MRIITGSSRGAKLRAPKGSNTRPTADRVKESLFNILSNKIIGKDILDIFAGSGALSLEALSRGARTAVLIDNAADSCKIIHANAVHTHLSRQVKIQHSDVFTALKKLSRSNFLFDIIFCDPPYHYQLCQRVLEVVDDSILREGGLFIAEVGADEVLNVDSTDFTLLRSISYGKTTMINIYHYGVHNKEELS